MRSEVNLDQTLMSLQWVPHYGIGPRILGLFNCPRCGLMCAAEPDECWACGDVRGNIRDPHIPSGDVSI